MHWVKVHGLTTNASPLVVNPTVQQPIRLMHC